MSSRAAAVENQMMRLRPQEKLGRRRENKDDKRKIFCSLDYPPHQPTMSINKFVIYFGIMSNLTYGITEHPGGKSFYYWIECIYTEENTFKISFWDCLAGIAMVLNGVKIK